MSRRTSEASKAIREAWEKERCLVLEGKGTRDWTRDQQQSIIEKGKAYDDEGRAFEGHHMKSAEAYPQFQGDANNIQFLTRLEHLDAHGGSYQNPTNGQYDPVSNSTKYFGEQSFKACEIIGLSDPVSTASGIKRISERSATEETKEATEKSSAPLDSSKPPKKKHFFAKIAEGFKGFWENHPKLSGVLQATALIGGSAAVGIAISANGSSSGDSSGASTDSYASNDDDFYAFNDEDDEDDEFDEDDYCNSSGLDEEYSESSLERDYPEDRLSPREHDVSGYDRMQNGKVVHVNSYKRGGKSEKNN